MDTARRTAAVVLLVAVAAGAAFALTRHDSHHPEPPPALVPGRVSALSATATFSASGFLVTITITNHNLLPVRLEAVLPAPGRTFTGLTAAVLPETTTATGTYAEVAAAAHTPLTVAAYAEADLAVAGTANCGSTDLSPLDLAVLVDGHRVPIERIANAGFFTALHHFCPPRPS